MCSGPTRQPKVRPTKGHFELHGLQDPRDTTPAVRGRVLGTYIPIAGTLVRNRLSTARHSLGASAAGAPRYGVSLERPRPGMTKGTIGVDLPPVCSPGARTSPRDVILRDQVRHVFRRAQPSNLLAYWATISFNAFRIRALGTIFSGLAAARTISFDPGRLTIRSFVAGLTTRTILISPGS